jgi:hypothetical protein
MDPFSSCQSGEGGGGDDRINALICAVAALGAIVATWPVAESGVNDDWSYARTALDLAQTGRLQYNGWAAAIVGVQALWGALFIKLFGFSFLVLRLSTALLAAGCAVLAYGLHRRAQLPPRLALFGALTLALSPVFVPNAASFMTEIPGLFLFLASVYGYVGVAGALEERGSSQSGSASAGPRFWRWLAVAWVAGLLAGTVRQVYWLVPMLAPFYLCLRARGCWRSAGVMLPLVVSAFGAFGGALACSLWFSAQPYTIHENVGKALRLIVSYPKPLAVAQFLAQFAVRIGLTLGAMALPVAITIPWLFADWLKAARRPRTFLLGGLLATLVVTLLALRLLGGNWCFPWLGNMFGSAPYLSGSAPSPTIPLTFPLAFWQLFSLVACGLICGVVVMTGMTGYRRLRQSGARVAAIRELAWLDRVLVPQVLFAVFAAAYLPILLLKAFVPDSFGVPDRYLLPILPGVTLIGLGLYHRESRRNHPPWAAWLVLILFAFYGIARTHDYFAQLRARLALAAQLEGRGIPRTRIMGGFEYDGWTQLSVVGYLNDSRIKKPENCYSPATPPPFKTVYGLWKLVPVVRPDFVLSLGRHRDLYDADVAPVSFRCWLPPFRRELVVQTGQRELIPVGSLPSRTHSQPSHN